MARNIFSGLFGRKKTANEAPPTEETGATDKTGATDENTAPDASEADALQIDAPPPENPLTEEAPVDAADTPTPDTPLPDAPLSDAPPETKDEGGTEKKRGWLSRLRAGLSRSSDRLSEGVAAIFTKRRLDDDTIEELEDLLISADLGVAAAGKVTAALAKDRFDKEIADAEVRAALAETVSDILQPCEQPLVIDEAAKPFVILVTGVNGAGKTTTIGKLAARFRGEGRSVMIAAGDTFRAAAVEQLAAWGARAGVEVVSRETGADAAGLAFDAVKTAQAAGTDVLMVDTAGRLQNRRELMDELAKIVRVVRKLDETAPHATLLVLDATVGQNALSQAAAFKDIADVSGLVMTKLDGTARGGVLVALTEKFALPIHYIGVGEGIDDLQPFKADAFARALAGLDA